MAEKKLSPRQRMINMMYLVLTALLALNVSKEVLQSFFTVNTGIVRTTSNFNDKNQESYFEFDNAANNNPAKFKGVRDQAFSVKKQADNISEYIQSMKYQLVYYTDKSKIALGNPSEVLKDGKPITKEEGNPNYITVQENGDPVKWDDLTPEQKLLPIAYLGNKKDRYKSQNLFYDLKRAARTRKDEGATVLKKKIISYRDSLISVAGENTFLIKKINEVCNVNDIMNNKSGNLDTWEKYNFADMPAVGSLTILSKIQSDMRNIEADVISYLKRNIDAKSLKFTSAEGIQIPKTNFVLRGDSFRAEIFITAKNEDQDPDIYVGEYDSLGNGAYQMVGDYDIVKVTNGKGLFARRTTSEGIKKWGGLIAMKTETGTKYYPFSGEYLVAAKTAVVSPVNMNVLYLEVDNPLKISVPGYTAGEISAVINNGKMLATKKSLGEYSARPSKKGKALVTLFADVEGKRTKMGVVEFRVKKVPPPEAKLIGAKNINGTIVIGKMMMVNAGGIYPKLKDFDFKGVRYTITSFRLTGVYKGEQMKDDTNGQQFSKKMTDIIKNIKSGNTITISNIKAKRVDYKNNDQIPLPALVIEIK